MFGIDDAVIGGLVSGAAGLIGGSNANAANSANASSANQLGAMEMAANQNIQQIQFGQTQAFNADQAQQQRTFAANQVTGAEAFNSSEAQKNRDFQLNMSNTAYQRGVADMKKAGINPIMAYAQGGASTGSGSTASVSPASGTSASASPGGLPGIPGGKAAVMQDVLSPAISSAQQGMKLATDIQNSQVNRGLTKSQTDKTDADTANVESQTAYNLQNTSNAKEIGRRLSNEADASEYAVPLAAQQVRNTATQASLNDANTTGRLQTNVRESDVGPGNVWNLQTWDAAARRISPFVSDYISPSSTSTATQSAPNPTSIPDIPVYLKNSNFKGNYSSPH